MRGTSSGGRRKVVAKSDLPRKTCPVCGRDFVWRRKWERCWEAVKYRSDACRKGTPR